jgi:hypothetical protein
VIHVRDLLLGAVIGTTAMTAVIWRWLRSLEVPTT